MKKNDFVLFLTIYVPVMILISIVAMSCTLSFQNISTHGVAKDVVDENLENDPDIDGNLYIPGVE